MFLVEPVASRENREWGQYLILVLCPVCLVTLTGSLSIPKLPTSCHKAGSMPQGLQSAAAASQLLTVQSTMRQSVTVGRQALACD